MRLSTKILILWVFTASLVFLTVMFPNTEPLSEKKSVNAEKEDLSLIAKTEQETEPEELRIENVKKVFLRDFDSYSLLCEDSFTKELAESGDIRYIPFIESNKSQWPGVNIIVKVYNDVEGESGYAVVKFYNEYWFTVDIHTKLENITGADYKYQSGKQTKTGTTREVE